LHKEHMKITPTLDSLAKAIIADASTDSAKVARIYHWVQRNIRYISIKGALASQFGGHYAQITYDNKYGDCSDKAIFFSTLLRAVSIEAYPIILLTNDAGFLNRDLFPFWWGNHAITEVWLNGKPQVLDATGNLFRFPYYWVADCDIWYCNFVRGQTVYNPPEPPADEAMRSRTFVRLETDGSAFITDSMFFSGDLEASYRGYFENNPETRHKQIVESFVASRNPGSKVKDFKIYNTSEIDKPFSLRFNYNVPDYIKKAGKYYLLEIPALKYAFPEIALNERSYDIKKDYPFQRLHDVTIQIPDGFVAEFVPGEINVSNKYFDYSARYERVGKIIRFTDEFNIKLLRIPKSDYDSYKKDAEAIISFVKERIFLSKAN
jgi:hypothetical protein